MTDAVIELVKVEKRFGDFVAVKGVDIAIERGEFFSLLGPSGCGKTTTLRMIAGFEQPTSGEIRLEGKDVSKTPPYRRNVNTVFQHYALFPHMSIFDNVAFGPRSAEARQGGDREAGRRDARGRPPRRLRRPQARPSSPAASSSGSPWPGPWSTTRAPCCSTSRSAPST